MKKPKVKDSNQVESELAKVNYYLAKAQEIGKIGTWELDLQKNVLIWTDENYKIFGVPIGTTMTYELFLNCVHPDDRDYVHEKWSEGVKNKSYDIEHQLFVEGEVKWVREKAEFESDSEGNPILAIGFTQDITDQKVTEKRLQESMEQFRMIAEQMWDMVFVTDADGIVTYASPACGTIFKCTPKEMVGVPFMKFLDEKEIPKAVQAFTKAISSRQTSKGLDLVMKRKDGSLFLGELTASYFNKNEASGTLGLIRDVTERKENEIALKEKITELERFKDITVGRESTMIELKKEVNDLLLSIGKKEKYKIV